MLPVFWVFGQVQPDRPPARERESLGTRHTPWNQRMLPKHGCVRSRALLCHGKGCKASRDSPYLGKGSRQNLVLRSDSLAASRIKGTLPALVLPNPPVCVHPSIPIHIHTVHHTAARVTWSSTVQTLQILCKQRLDIFSSFIPRRQKSGLSHKEK